MKEIDILQDKQFTYKRNIEPRSRSHCCRTKAISTTISECVFVTLDKKHAEHKHRFISPVASLAVPCSSALYYKLHEKVIEHKKCVLIFSKILSENFLTLRNILRVIAINLRPC